MAATGHNLARHHVSRSCRLLLRPVLARGAVTNQVPPRSSQPKHNLTSPLSRLTGTAQPWPGYRPLSALPSLSMASGAETQYKAAGVCCYQYSSSRKRLEVLMVFEQDRTWTLPGGKRKGLDEGEAEATAAREVEEETHWMLPAEDVRQRISYQEVHWLEEARYLLFLAHLPGCEDLPDRIAAARAEGKIHPEAMKVKGAAWLSLAELTINKSTRKAKRQKQEQQEQQGKGGEQGGLAIKRKLSFTATAALHSPVLAWLEAREAQLAAEAGEAGVAPQVVSAVAVKAAAAVEATAAVGAAVEATAAAAVEAAVEPDVVVTNAGLGVEVGVGGNQGVPEMGLEQAHEAGGSRERGEEGLVEGTQAAGSAKQQAASAADESGAQL
ncbi:hypothetical protein QJQ45_016880, partial [Haematococcus lacustris]